MGRCVIVYGKSDSGKSRSLKNWGCWALWDEALRYTGNGDLVKVTDTKKHIADEVKRRYDNGQTKRNEI